jgi:phosphoribosylanthranilate isomerase
MFVKICGITRPIDAQNAVRLGATALGFVFWPESPRAVAPERVAEIVATVPTPVMTVGVFVNEELDVVRRIVASTGIGVVQLHGDESPDYAAALEVPVFRSVTLAAFEAASRAWPEQTTFLLDAADPVRRGGTGRTLDWSRAAAAARRSRVILAGGLTPANVADAIAVVQPFGVDVSSGVEEAPGVKDGEKVKRFLDQARHAGIGYQRAAERQ